MKIHLLLLMYTSAILTGCTTSRQEYFEPNRAHTITKLEVQAGPSKRIEQLMLAQLGDIMLDEGKAYLGKKLVLPLTEYAYFTAPTLTDTFDVCKMNEVKFLFESIESGKSGPTSRSRVNGIETTTYYHVAEGVEIDQLYQLDEDAKLAMSAKCKKLDVVFDDWVEADSEADAVEGTATLRRIHQATKQELDKVEISCFLNHVDQKKSCDEILQSIPPNTVNLIMNCESSLLETPGSSCLDAWADFYSITIAGQNDNTKLPKRIHVNQLIVLIHERIE